MQSKLTLRLDDILIRKAKRLAKRRGTSVSRIVSDYIIKQSEEIQISDMPSITASMVGVLKREGTVVDEQDYKEYLESRYL
jgi:predicted transcriptional regulator